MPIMSESALPPSDAAASGSHAPSTGSDALTLSWQALEARAASRRPGRIIDLLRNESGRPDRLGVSAAGLYIDLSRHLISSEDLDALLAHAVTAGFTSRREAMFSGAHINATEDRAVLHTALRLPRGRSLSVDGQDVVGEVHEVLDRMGRFCDRVRDGSWTGVRGAAITDVLNIGIGGSQLGPELACEALADFADGPRVHFLASLDPAHWARLARSLDPHRTLVVVASKSWKTPETELNARVVRDWLLAAGIPEDGLHHHCVGLTTNTAAASAYGIDPANVFPFWDWVGGRYSMWSAIGLPIMLSIGPKAFGQMLAGAHAMDRHFVEAPPEANAPLLMALVSLWDGLVHDSSSEAVIPYCTGLRRLPAYLQQLTMESNGKRVRRDGRPVPWPTARVTWGEPGTEAQHSFFQLLHQGTAVIPVDFVLVVPPDDRHGAGLSLLANGLAQADALLNGRDLAGAEADLRRAGRSAEDARRLAPHLVYPGNRPTSTILLESLDPFSFGALIALYEHRTAALGWLWDINSFDQWGVEVGKQRANALLPLLQEPPGEVVTDPATENLARRIRAIRSARS